MTVRADDPAEALERHAAARGAKFVRIELARGRVPVQPMFTLRRSGALAAVRDSVFEFAGDVRAAGFGVTRVKIEATPWTEGVPRTDAEGFALGERFYFEHHVKLLLGPGANTAALVAVAEAHAAHVSANARRVRADGRAERFVTQRCRLVGDGTAAGQLDALVSALADYEIVSAEREFVVHDSDESLDAGWIDERVGAS